MIRLFIQSQCWNVSKGPAVHSLQAQADKAEYSRAMRKVLEEKIRKSSDQSEAEVCELLWEETEDHKEKITAGRLLPVLLSMNVRLCSMQQDLSAGPTCAEGIHYHTGPNGLLAPIMDADSVESYGGIEMRRF